MTDSPQLICHQDQRRWPCELARDWSVGVDRLKGRVSVPYHFRTEKPGHSCAEWLRLDVDGRVTLRKGYSTDGCSMVPDFPRALPGCVLHDALRQATTLDPDCPWTRDEADRIFLEVMEAHGFNWFGRWLYYLGVAGPIGWLYSWISHWLKPPQDRVCRG